ncbi:MAG: universal stress protein [Rhodospirillales bacterium]|nr:universal stress protein [Rhodospirillales bacterium]
MNIRKILVPIEDAEHERIALRTAFAVARTFGAHVEGLHVRIEAAETVPFVGEGMSGAVVQELIDLSERESAARASGAREMFVREQHEAGMPTVAAPNAGGPSAAWIERSGREDEALVHLGRLSDLIVIGRPAPGDTSGTRMTLSVTLFETGRPVLVAGHEAYSVGKKIVVAWNGSAEAARAVAAAMPFLHAAEQVTAVSVQEESAGRATLDDIADYLTWHGIASARFAVAPHGAAGQALADAAAGADLVVMGGYSHSRLRELILGGVTRYMLEKAAMPLLIVH